MKEKVTQGCCRIVNEADEIVGDYGSNPNRDQKNNKKLGEYVICLNISARVYPIFVMVGNSNCSVD